MEMRRLLEKLVYGSISLARKLTVIKYPVKVCDVYFDDLTSTYVVVIIFFGEYEPEKINIIDLFNNKDIIHLIHPERLILLRDIYNKTMCYNALVIKEYFYSKGTEYLIYFKDTQHTEMFKEEQLVNNQKLLSSMQDKHAQRIIKRHSYFLAPLKQKIKTVINPNVVRLRSIKS